jgi:hypothetical protein
MAYYTGRTLFSHSSYSQDFIHVSILSNNNHKLFSGEFHKFPAEQFSLNMAKVGPISSLFSLVRKIFLPILSQQSN